MCQERAVRFLRVTTTMPAPTASSAAAPPATRPVLPSAPVSARSSPPPFGVAAGAAGAVVAGVSWPGASWPGVSSAGACGSDGDGAGAEVDGAGAEVDGAGDCVQSFVPPFQAAISLSLMTGRSGPLGSSPCSKPSFASSLPSYLTAPR
ncbi:hypothetical protein SGLAM104S_08951 [Streptomyces glaucescens]